MTASVVQKHIDGKAEKEARLRRRFDADVADALAHGIRYKSVREAMHELYL